MRRRIVLGMLGAAVVVWAAIAILTLLSARDATQRGVDALEAARGALTPEAVVEGRGLDRLQLAREEFARANGRVRSPWVTPLRALPVLGRQVRSVDAMTSAASDVVDVGVDAVETARRELDRRPPDGPARVQSSIRIADAATDAVVRLEGVDLGPADALIAPLRDARGRFEAELIELEDAAVRLRDASRAFAAFLAGPSRYLVLAANNNEMRVGSGTFLQASELTVVDGRFSLGEMRSVSELRLPPGAVEATGDFAERWGWLLPTQEWPNLGASPRFDGQAELAAGMWHAATGGEVDGVLVLDPVALRALLRATGPVVVDGVEYGPANVLDELFLDQYEGTFGNVGRAERRDRLGDIAQAAIAGLDAGGWEAATLAEELRDAAAGRHVLAWARDAAAQRGWEAAGVAGTLHEDSLVFGLHNRGGNKLDQFLEVDASLTVAGDRLTVVVSLRNGTPPDLGAYVAGPHPNALGGAEGLYQGLAVFLLPPGVGDAEVHGDPGGGALPLVVAGPDGRHATAAVYVEVPTGESRALRLDARVDPQVDRIRVEPSARMPRVRWHLGGEEWRDARARTVEI